MWDQIRRSILEDFSDLPDPGTVTRMAIRLLLAAVLGGLLGYERQQRGKAAGVRTHMLVAVGSAFFVHIAQQAGMSLSDLSRVIQGIVTGIGFLGAGAILKQSDQGLVRGLTTAASVWMTTAVGVAAGLGRDASAVLGTLATLAILSVVPRIEHWLEQRERPTPERQTPPTPSSASESGSQSLDGTIEGS